jgi:cytochrome bd-type quinol oxidase subunit 1
MPEGLDSLVKLASMGTAGVCVLAIFIIGVSLFKLSNDTSKEKVSLIKKYMNMCIIIAIICTISGVANAVFNQQKTNDVNTKWSDAYDRELKKADTEKNGISATLTLLRQQVSLIHNLPPSVSSSLDSTEKRVLRFQLTPREQVVREVQAGKLGR